MAKKPLTTSQHSCHQASQAPGGPASPSRNKSHRMRLAVPLPFPADTTAAKARLGRKGQEMKSMPTTETPPSPMPLLPPRRGGKG
jgi:hypothetical protein